MGINLQNKPLTMSLKPLNYLRNGIYVAGAKNKGRGVFTIDELDAGLLIETAPVIVMQQAERTLLDQTLLHDYIFEWGEKKSECCMALGLVPLYNHSYQANCEYEMDFKKQLISVKTIRKIAAGEELFINYNGDWNEGKKVWFDAS